MVFNRPEIACGRTVRITTPCGYCYITMNRVDNKIVEVFIIMGKCGGCMNAVFEAMGRTISIGLQSGAGVNNIADTLSGILCKSSSFENPSCFSRIAGVLRKEQIKLDAEEEEGS